jgi:CubicO group peptidase (beta-lactamase class C family)
MPGSRFAAIGIFGQSILVDPAKKLVVVMSGSWPTATGEKLSAARAAFWKKIEAAAG